MYQYVRLKYNLILPNVSQVNAKTILNSLQESRAKEKESCDTGGLCYQSTPSLIVKEESEGEKTELADGGSFAEDNCYTVKVPEETDKVIIDWGDITQVINRDSVGQKVVKSPSSQKKRVRRAIPSNEKSFLRAVYAEYCQKCSPAKITDIIMQIYSGDGNDHLVKLHNRFPNLAIPKKRVLNTHEQIYLCIYNNFVRKKR